MCVVVNARQEVVYYSGRTSRYLEPPAGAPTVNVVNLARRGLRSRLRSALSAVMRTGVPLVQPAVTVLTEEGRQTINLVVRPMPEARENAGLYVIVFQELAGPVEGAERRRTKSDGEDPVVQELEAELQSTRESLEATIDQLESSNEQLKSSNEELVAMNEELQSANEEYETSKEELQSINEEMSTINAELTEKIAQLDRANDDLRKLVPRHRRGRHRPGCGPPAPSVYPRGRGAVPPDPG